LNINFAESFLQEGEPLEFGYEELAIRSKQIKSDSNSNPYSNELVDDANKVRIEEETDYNNAFTMTLKSATSTSTTSTTSTTTTSTSTTSTPTVFSDLNRSSESNVIDDGNDAVEATTTKTFERKNVPNNELSNYFDGKEGHSLAEKNPLKDDASKNVERLSDSGGLSINSTKEVSRKKIWSQGFRYKMQEFLRKNQQRIRSDQEAQTSRTSKVHFLII
jgi:hypothetical protein